MQNEYLLDFKGKTLTRKLENDLLKYLLEQRKKHMFKHPSFSLNTAPLCLITVGHKNDPKHIKAVGGSVPKDLFTDQWGKIQAAIFRASGLGATTVSVIDTSNTPRTLSIYNTGNTWTISDTIHPVGTQIQIGKGTTVAVRTNYKIETAFTDAPESAVFNTGIGGWNSGNGTIKFSGVITVGGSDTIKESGFLGVFGPSSWEFLLSHENISPVVPFVVGDPVTVGYTLFVT